MTALEQLRLQGVIQLRIEFSGRGDEGDVQDVFLTRRRLRDGLVVHEGYTLQPGDVVSEQEEVPYTNNLIWDFARDVSDKADYDWYNNEGGHGTAIVDVQTGKVTFQRFQNEVRSVDVGELERELS